MHLTRHGNGYRFQRRIPADLVPILGKSPIRINLGNISSRSAARATRLHVGHLDRPFLGILTRRRRSMPQDTDPRDAIIAELQTELADLTKAFKETVSKADEVIELQQRAYSTEMEVLANRMKVEAFEREKEIRQEVSEVYGSFIDICVLDLRRSNWAFYLSDILEQSLSISPRDQWSEFRLAKRQP